MHIYIWDCDWRSEILIWCPWSVTILISSPCFSPVQANTFGFLCLRLSWHRDLEQAPMNNFSKPSTKSPLHTLHIHQSYWIELNIFILREHCSPQSAEAHGVHVTSKCSVWQPFNFNVMERSRILAPRGRGKWSDRPAFRSWGSVLEAALFSKLWPRSNSWLDGAPYHWQPRAKRTWSGPGEKV
jgi:hypothetical protein